jgi:ADP-heptose:LPS heptosyltransferase
MLRRNVLIFHSAALGDFVLTWPLGLALGRLFPQSRIIYVTQRQKGLLVEKSIGLEWTDAETGWHHLFGEPSALPEPCRRRLEGAHLIVGFSAGNVESWRKAVAEIATGAQIVLADARPATTTHTHATEGLVSSLSSAPALQSALRQMLSSVQGKGAGPRRGDPAGPIAIQPGSGSPEKCWPLESYLKLIEEIHAAGRRCKVLLGEVELDRWPSAAIRQIESATESAHPATYCDLLAELSTSSGFVGNDSGPGHLAGTIGLPTVILFGPTDPAIWRPLGPRVRTLHQHRISDLTPHEVFDAVMRQTTLDGVLAK